MSKIQSVRINGHLKTRLFHVDNYWRFQVEVKNGNHVKILNIYCNSYVKSFIEHVKVGEEIGLVLFKDEDSVSRNRYYAAFAVPQKIKA